MNEKIAAEIQNEQSHGRAKYGKSPDDLAHDDSVSDAVWYRCLNDHNERAFESLPMDRRAHLIKLAGLAVSAVEAIDRRIEKAKK